MIWRRGLFHRPGSRSGHILAGDAARAHGTTFPTMQAISLGLALAVVVNSFIDARARQFDVKAKPL